MGQAAAEDPAREGVDANAPSRDEGAAANPPSSSGAEEGNRAPSPARVGEPHVEATAPEGTPVLGKGPMMQADSDDEVEEI